MRNDARSGLLATLPTPTIGRISIDLSGGVGIAVAAAVLLNVDGALVFSAVVVGLLSALIAWLVMYRLWKDHQLRWLVATMRGLSPRRRRALLIVPGALLMFDVWMVAGPGAVWAGVTDLGVK